MRATTKGARRRSVPGGPELRIRVVAVAALAATVVAGCATGPAEGPAVQPLSASADRPRTAAPVTTSTTTVVVVEGDRTEPAPTEPAPAEDGRAELRSTVDEVLLAYDRALTHLAADPAGRAPTGTPERAAWDAVVVPGSALSTGMLQWLVRRHQQDGTVVVPDGSGLSYRHRSLLVEPPVEGAVSFTWCGHSPGVGRDAATDEVVDDGVAHAHGTGQLRAVGGRWVLEALDESDLEVLAPGSPDPCPAEVAGVTAQDTVPTTAPEVGR